MEIIPAIDLIEGKCVRLTQGDFERKTVYSDDPVDVARRFEAAGLKRLHMVDLDGARTGSPVNLSTLKRVAAATDLVIDFGGGVKWDEDVTDVLDSGAAMINVGSVAVRDPERFSRWLNEFGADRFLLAADVKGGKLAVKGWQETSDLELLPFLGRWMDSGLTQAFVTDVASDGALSGPAFGLYKDVVNAIPQLSLIASGGVRSLDDLRRLHSIGCSGAIVGKSIYEGLITLEELNQFRDAC